MAPCCCWGAARCASTAAARRFPEEVEEALKQHASVRDAVAVGIPDAVRRDHLRSGGGGAWRLPVLHELSEHVKSHLAHYKAPRHLVVVDSIGRAPNGKVDYRRLTAVAVELPWRRRPLECSHGSFTRDDRRRHAARSTGGQVPHRLHRSRHLPRRVRRRAAACTAVVTRRPDDAPVAAHPRAGRRASPPAMPTPRSRSRCSSRRCGARSPTWCFRSCCPPSGWQRGSAPGRRHRHRCLCHGVRRVLHPAVLRGRPSVAVAPHDRRCR